MPESIADGRADQLTGTDAPGGHGWGLALRDRIAAAPVRRSIGLHEWLVWLTAACHGALVMACSDRAGTRR